ncbi:hypothetical protein LEL_10698 [Akanthomyces lecanii RCEF 1005]|uniref:Uncharacterized protein n=1 Tax=Akanthomyces lecanii RCEF 1005 TaxID=1081108 RepID=A0A167W1V1_CORDF|nr:hypothetical protein LEL_10698 [Akanthomyces lecanii RCEF 1005]
MSYYASCDELRGNQCDDPEETRIISSLPRMAKCYGWMEISPTTIPLPLQAPPVEVDRRKRSFNPEQKYFAMLYEFVEDGENAIAAVDEVADFLWHAGFCFTLSPLERILKRGVLVDMSDIIHFDASCGRTSSTGEKRSVSYWSNRAAVITRYASQLVSDGQRNTIGIVWM